MGTGITPWLQAIYERWEKRRAEKRQAEKIPKLPVTEEMAARIKGVATDKVPETITVVSHSQKDKSLANESPISHRGTQINKTIVAIVAIIVAGLLLGFYIYFHAHRFHLTVGEQGFAYKIDRKTGQMWWIIRDEEKPVKPRNPVLTTKYVPIAPAIPPIIQPYTKPSFQDLSLSTHSKEREKISIKPDPEKSVERQKPEGIFIAHGSPPGCGFPITNYEIVNYALKEWCQERQKASYQQMRQEERSARRSNLWEKLCKESQFSSYWKGLSFEYKRELSTTFFQIAGL